MGSPTVRGEMPVDGPARQETAAREAAQETADVVVIGSGGAGLLAACRAADAGMQVSVLERADRLGGTTAVSGGMLWMPCNRPMAEAGLGDDPDDALRYLRAVTDGTVAVERLEQYVRLAPVVVDYLHRRTPVRLAPLDRPDYHSAWSGARDAGRTLDVQPFGTSGVPGLADRIRSAPHFTALTYGERHRLRWAPDRAEALATERDLGGVLTVGRGLVAGLLVACEARGVRVRTGVRARALCVDAGRVTGVRADRASGPVEYRATVGVVLASGGFEWDDRLSRAFLGRTVTPVSPPGNCGDGLRMAASAGAALGGMSQAWWTLVVTPPQERLDDRQLARLLIGERCLPGSVMVGRRGRRFVNEAVNYNDLGKALLAFDASAHAPDREPVWLVFDERFRRRYPVGAAGPDRPAPDWFLRGDDPADLAAAMGVPPEALTQTLAEFNAGARDGVDRRFGRGGTTHDRYYGDDRRPGNPCVGELSEPPFWAVPVRLGALGTKGGPVTDAGGRVLRWDGGPVHGLYACGNVAETVMGPGYPGSGGTLGPALVDGFRCGAALAVDRAGAGQGVR